MPFMVLSGVTLFPQALLPLFIFEPRYRQMLAGSLAGSRMFGITSLEQEGPGGRIIAGVGLVRACVEQQDGTSHVILQGLRRVEIEQVITHKPFLLARIRELSSFNSEGVEVEALADKLKEVIHDSREKGHELPSSIMDYLDRTSDPDIFSDIVSYLLLKRQDFRVQVMHTLDLKARLRLLLKMVPQELAREDRDNKDLPQE